MVFSLQWAYNKVKKSHDRQTDIYILSEIWPVSMKKMLPVRSVNKGCCSHQAITLQLPQRWTLRELRIETRCPPRCTLRGFRVRKHQILALQSWGAYQWNDFNEPRLLHLPIHRKALNCLTWDIWFSFMNSKLSMFWPPGLCGRNSYISWMLFGTVPQSHLRGCIQGLNPQKVCRIKRNSQLLGCVFFSVNTRKQRERSNRDYQAVTLGRVVREGLWGGWEEELENQFQWFRFKMMVLQTWKLSLEE